MEQKRNWRKIIAGNWHLNDFNVSVENLSYENATKEVIKIKALDGTLWHFEYDNKVGWIYSFRRANGFGDIACETLTERIRLHLTEFSYRP